MVNRRHPSKNGLGILTYQGERTYTMKMIGTFNSDGTFQGSIELGQFDTTQLTTSKIPWADKLTKKSFSIKVSKPTKVEDLPGFAEGCTVKIQRKLRSLPYNEAQALNRIELETLEQRTRTTVVRVMTPAEVVAAVLNGTIKLTKEQIAQLSKE